MGITDGTFICDLCGMDLTGCFLCGKAPLVDRRAALAREEQAEREAEAELARQSASIKREAARRHGF